MERAVRAIAAVGVAASVMVGLGGCAAVVVGGAMVGGAMVATDRRSTGIQLEDEAIERRINRTIAERIAREDANVTVTSYNRKVLLTGETPREAVKAQIEEIARNAENVRTVANELFVAPLTTAAQRNNDLAIAARLRAAYVADKDIPINTVKPVTQRGIVYLMGRVTEAEGDAAARAASRVQGVLRVVKVFDYLTPEEAAQFTKPAPTPESPRRP